MGILTHVGLLEGDKITPAARQAFVDAVNLLLQNGTSNFLYGGLPSELKVPGSELLSKSFNITPIEKHQQTFPAWHQTFIDTMFEKTAVALDVECGAGLIAPFGDPTVILPDLKLKAGIGIPEFVILMPGLPVTLPELFDIEITLPELIAEFSAKVAIPNIPLPPFLPLPEIPPVNIPIPPFPLLPKWNIPAVQLYFNIPPIPPIPPIPMPNWNFQLPLPILAFLFCAVITAIPIIIAKLLLDPPGFLAAVAEGPVAIILFVLVIVLEVLGACLGIELKNVLTFLAGFLVYIEKLVLMLIVVIVGQIVGQGLLVQLVATSIGLV